SRRGITPVVAASWQERVALSVHMTSNGTLAVRNNIADLTGGGEIGVNGTLANPVLIGEVRLDEGGRLRFQNVDYTLVRGTVNFQNPFRIDPYIDITLEARVSGGTSAETNSGPVDVTVNLTGTIDRITPAITSDPPTSDITLFSLLGLGGLAKTTTPGATAGQPQPTTSQSLYQAAAGILGTRVFPFVDSFSYDPGLQDTDPGPKVGFQKRISSELTTYLIYNTLDQKR